MPSDMAGELVPDNTVNVARGSSEGRGNSAGHRYVLQGSDAVIPHLG